MGPATAGDGAAGVVVVDRRLTGPPEAANGGYACGLVAGYLGGHAEVTLRRPVPVGRPLALRRTASGVALVDGDTLVAEGVPACVRLRLPGTVSAEQAEAAMASYPALDWGERMMPCFVCGPGRPDGFGVFPGPVPGRDLVAAVWTPAPGIAEPDGTVPAPFAWAVLDCTGTWAGMAGTGLVEVAPLGRMAAGLHRPVRAGERYVAVGWPLGVERRKLFSAAALVAADGAVVAAATLTCISPRDPAR